MIELVIFDLGGVMIRLVSGWAEACALAGVEGRDFFTDKTRRDRLTDLCNEHEHGRIDETTLYAQGAALTGLSREQFAAAFLAWIREPYPGVHELVHRVKRTGVRTACLSNTTDGHWRLMNHDPCHRLPLDELDYRFTSFQIGAMKPAPAIYEHVERATGIAPGAMLFFDDAQANVHAARRRGWQAHRIDPAGDPPAQIAARLRDHGLLESSLPQP